MDSVSDQLPSSLLTQQAYVVSMIGERDSIYRLRESVGEYDAAAGTEQPTLQEEVETLLQIIKQQVENPPCSVTGYTAEVWQATDTYGDLERIYNASHWYINSHERSILEAQQSYIDTLDRIQEDCIIHNWEVLDHCLKLLHVIIIFPMLKKDRSIHIKVNLIRLTRWIVIQEVYSKKWILLNIGKQEEEML